MAEHKLLDEQWLLAVKAVIDCSDLKDRYQPEAGLGVKMPNFR